MKKVFAKTMLVSMIITLLLATLMTPAAAANSKLNAPTGLIALYIPNNDFTRFSLYIGWKDAKNADGYEVYYAKVNEPYKLLGISESTSLPPELQKSPPNNETIKIKVRAFKNKFLSSKKDYSPYTNEFTLKSYAKVKKVSLSLSGNAKHIVCGSSKQVIAVVEPSNATYKNLKWSSSNNAIATINDKGILVASKSRTGKVTIYAEASNKIKYSFELDVYKYDIRNATKYAHEHWNTDSTDLCAAYAAKCLINGGVPIVRKGYVVDFYNQLLMAGWTVISDPKGCKEGDIIMYSYVDKNGKKHYSHAAYCVGIRDGIPIVNQHNSARQNLKYTAYKYTNNAKSTNTFGMRAN